MKPRCWRRNAASASGPSPLTLWPSMMTSPSVGARMQPRIDSSVVLPLPEGPISSVSSPACRVSDTPFSARTLPAPWPRSLTTLRACRTVFTVIG